MNIGKIAFLIFSLNLSCLVYANNITVSNVVTGSQNVVSDFTYVNFDLSWENSWRTSSGPSNWDAAWVFVKFQVGGSNPVLTGASSSGTTVTVNSTTDLRVGMPVIVSAGTGAFAANTRIVSIANATQFVVSATPSTALSSATVTCQRIWEHACLNTLAANHSGPAGTAFSVPTDSMGVFIYRSADGTGTFSLSNVALRWDYGINGVNDTALIQIRVFAIEMVYVPQGSFSVGSGSGGSGLSEFYTHTTNVPFQITGEGQITVGTNSGNLYYANNTYSGDQSGPIPANFPKGFNAFYCMKYEITQGQYRDFLNTLTRQQQANRLGTDGTVGRFAGGFTWNGTAFSATANNALTSPANRNGLRLIVVPSSTIEPRTYACDLTASSSPFASNTVNQSNDGEWIAMSQINWMDGCTFADWAGLRPMTELEYEKACRGTLAPVANEFSWGSTSITMATGISNKGALNESITNNGANCAYNEHDSIQGPIRVGAFATANTNRVQAGASYYGIMEMTGNLWERCVTVGNIDGRSFTGLHGNGRINENGHADVGFWPGISPTGVIGATGSGFRGGPWVFNLSYAYLSDRSNASGSAGTSLTDRSCGHGFRAVRKDP